MVRPAGAPVPALASAAPKSMQKLGVKHDMRYSGAVFRSDAMGLDRYPHDVDSSTEVFAEILACVRGMSRVYASIELISIKSNSDRTRYVCRTRGWGSSYCMNVGRDHTSNTIYFQLDYKKGLSQRCFSNKDCPPGCLKTCRSYESPSVPVPEMLRAALFPQTELSSKTMVPRGRPPAAGAMATASARPYVAPALSGSMALLASSLAAASAASAASAAAAASAGGAGLFVSRGASAAPSAVASSAASDASSEPASPCAAAGAGAAGEGGGAAGAPPTTTLAKRLDSMSMMELVKAQREVDGKADIKSKRMREEIVGIPQHASKTAMPQSKRSKPSR